jgi:hypothetical protein
VAQDGYTYWWLSVLRPYRDRGFVRGWLNPYTVTLSDGAQEITLNRGGWMAAASIEAAAEPDDREELSGDEFAMLHELVRTDVGDLSQSAIAFLG